MQQGLKQKAFHIHFVCTGNAYRSRLAEAYLNSRQLPGIYASSSGIAADRSFQYNGPISWYAMRLLHEYRLIPFMSPFPRQTTLHLLAEADLIIYMCQEHCDYVVSLAGYQPIAYRIWEIADMNRLGFDDREDTMEYLLACVASSEKTFQLIKARIDTLLQELEQAGRPFEQA